MANSKICRGRSWNSSVVQFQSYFISERSFFQFHEQVTKFANEVHHLTRFRECGLLVTVMLNDTHQAATKSELAVNLLKIAYKPNTSHYYSSMKQNDYIRVTFPENLSLQCFRTAALFMVTPNTESQNPIDCLWIENHLKM